MSSLRRAAALLILAGCTRAPAPTALAPPPRPAPEVTATVRCDLALEEERAPRALAAAAREALEEGEAERALACADAALAVEPRGAAALATRGSALAALERLDDARASFFRALALQPDDPAVLLGAAELLVRRLGPAREQVTAGLELALRGLRGAAARRDAVTAGRLALVAGMAQNDLGRSDLALPLLDRARAALPDHFDAVYEHGVALFELCRFEEAQGAFERALELEPDDPWALHQLGLVAERRGEERRASQLLARARTLAPREFEPELGVGPDEFRAEVQAAVARLPEHERRALRGVAVEVQELPDAEDLQAVEPPFSPSILGLFRGPSEDEPCTADDGPVCRSIVLYRKNLLRIARDRRELGEQVRVTLEHELGHLHGLDEDALRAMGLE